MTEVQSKRARKPENQQAHEQASQQASKHGEKPGSKRAGKAGTQASETSKHVNGTYPLAVAANKAPP